MTASNANYPETLRLLRKYQSDPSEPSGQTFTRIAQELEAARNIAHADLCVLSRIFHERDFPISLDASVRINEWLKAQIAAAASPR